MGLSANFPGVAAQPTGFGVRDPTTRLAWRVAARSDPKLAVAAETRVMLLVPRSAIDRRRVLYQDALAHIAAHFAGALTLGEVARGIGTSRRQLQRCFAEIGATTFRSQLTVVRLERAATLLVESSAPVSAIAGYVGFTDPSQFAKAFRRHHRLSPSDFRRRGQRRDRPAAQATACSIAPSDSISLRVTSPDSRNAGGFW